MFWLSLALPLVACSDGSGVSGVYAPTGDSIYKKFDFQSKDKVQVTNFMDQTVGGEFAVMDDGRVRIMVAGDVLTLKKADDGCLVVTTGDATEAQTAEMLGATEEEMAKFGHFCKQ
jgi:hypothetical protein